MAAIAPTFEPTCRIDFDHPAVSRKVKYLKLLIQNSATDYLNAKIADLPDLNRIAFKHFPPAAFVVTGGFFSFVLASSNIVRIFANRKPTDYGREERIQL